MSTRLGRPFRPPLVVAGLVLLVASVALVLWLALSSWARPSATAAAARLRLAVSQPPAPRSARAPLVPRPDGKGRIEIPVADRLPARLPAEGLPAGWDLKEFEGRADVGLVRDEAPAIHLRSRGTSYLLSRDVIVDLSAQPVLSWWWKVMRLPGGADVRSSAADDQAAQLYVVFPRWPSPQTRSDVLGYVWDTSAPVGTTMTSTKAANVRILVIASGPGGLGTWRRFERNVTQDYTMLFGQAAPRIGKLALMIDSNDTQSEAETLVRDLRFEPVSPRKE